MLLSGPPARYAAPAAPAVPRHTAASGLRVTSRQRRISECPRSLAAGAISPVLEAGRGGEAHRPKPTPPLRQLSGLQRDPPPPSAQPGLQSVDSSRSRQIAAIALEAAERGPCDGAGVRSQLRSRWPNLEMEQKDMDALNQWYVGTGDIHGVLSGEFPFAADSFSWLDPMRQPPAPPEQSLRDLDAPYNFSDCRAEWDYRDDSQYRSWLEERSCSGKENVGGARGAKENAGRGVNGSQSDRTQLRSAASAENIFSVNGVAKMDAIKLPARKPLDRCHSALAFGVRQPTQPCGQLYGEERDGWSSFRSTPLHSPKAIRRVPLAHSARFS